MKTSCNVIKDLLPLYYDHVCSEDTSMLVEEHLKECEECKRLLTDMREEIKVSNKDINEAEIISRVQKSIIEVGVDEYKEKRNRIAIIIDSFLNALIIAGIIIWSVPELMSGETSMLMVFVPSFAIFGMFIWADISYLIYQKKGTSALISDSFAKTSIGIKVFLMVIVFISAVVLGFRTMFS